MSDFPTHLYEAIRHLRPAIRNIATSVEIRSAKQGLNTGIRACLEILAERGDMPVPEIARALMVERQYVQRNVNELLLRQLAEKKPNPKHKKSTLIGISEEGRSQIETLKAAEANILRQLEGQISTQQIEGAIHVLSTLSRFFKELNDQDKALTAGGNDDA